VRHRNAIDMIGKKCGRLTVLSKALSGKTGSGTTFSRWNCICECGNEAVASGSNLRKGVTQSCGCFKKERMSEGNITHGHSKVGKLSPTYRIWAGIKARCFIPSGKNYKNYGGRGITMSDEWRSSFDAFLRDMGERPEGLSLDRINNDGNYEIGNCRWATRKEQANNKRPQVAKIRHAELLLSFICHCLGNPEERFWQALRNWSGVDSVLINDGVNSIDTFDMITKNLEAAKMLDVGQQ
jgi:hypothetical protein